MSGVNLFYELFRIFSTFPSIPSMSEPVSANILDYGGEKTETTMQHFCVLGKPLHISGTNFLTSYKGIPELSSSEAPLWPPPSKTQIRRNLPESQWLWDSELNSYNKLLSSSSN